VKQLYKAETDLDAFWGSIDTELEKLGDDHSQDALRRLLDQGSNMRRTQPWSEPHQKRANETRSKTDKPLPSDVLHEYQPLSQLRGEGVAEEEPADAEREPSPKPQPKFTVSKKAQQVIAKLFHDPDANDNTIGEVKRTGFSSAMTNLGFSTEHMHGSQWQFNPTDRLDVTRGIAFHELNPASAFSWKKARDIGVRLHRAYGWEGSLFMRS
jgi:hypothetical protein